MKKGLLLLLSALLLLGCVPSTAPEAEGIVFTDSLGREVRLPERIERIAASGVISQMVLFAIAPDLLVGLSETWDETAASYLPEEYYNLPELGQIYGGKGNFDPEALLNSGAQVVIDIGEPKDGAKEELDALSKQLGLPIVHLDATLTTTDEVYRVLGTLLNREAEGEALAKRCERMDEILATLAAIPEKPRVLYCMGDKGLNVLAKGSYHAELLDTVTDNAAVVDVPSSKGTGNEADMEQILLWDPDFIVFAADSIGTTVGDDPLWSELNAVKNSSYDIVPYGPYNWFGTPPSVQRYLGMLWLGATLYPDAIDYDLKTEVKEYFLAFYHCELTDEALNDLLGA